MKIEYTPAGIGSTVSKPYVSLIMCSQNKRIYVDGLIDSGSDHNLFSIVLAESCGIDLRHAARVSVAGFNHTGKKNKGYLVPVKYVLDNYEWVGDTVFVETEQPHGFLGQAGFFDAFNILFSYSHETIELNPVSAQKIDLLK
ncbi:MAG: hypothetical protein A3C02_02360 [Candidatus Andersenbacteria bacterium RIFCSPHIGHO2_02_FULL_45_11]|nr:MAG: hypothetical protein A2805_01790 [Candidatus Andersenbacteria bacterium RIFCSPHIGHO2_01_FULL_46_36]OGY34739.1 MAG: hypothetical protein A3C02_02360 [Candidatus Andersenbacteria bacterium RIFCSPHIGHO2_02_FULL_45_11]